MLIEFLERSSGTAFAAVATVSAGATGGDGSLSRITLRTALAALVSFALALLLGPKMIEWLRERFREPIISDSERLESLHRHKAKTPTMGGLFILAGILAAMVLLNDWTNRYVLACLVMLVGFLAIGVCDDLKKLATGHGLRVYAKLIAQVVVSTVVSSIVYSSHRENPEQLALALPWLSDPVGLGGWFVPLAVIVLVGSSNAVNLTDGLDGLACGCLIFGMAAMGAMAYFAGHAELARYLQVTPVPGAGELTVIAGAAIGAILGFLWFNCHPAQVFMGDTGSLPLGGLLGLLAVVSRQELLLVVIGGVFVAEAGSVVIQVVSYKWRRRRVFLCTPLHHHFQFLGWSENTIVVRFWIAAALFAVVGLASLNWNPTRMPAARTASRTEVVIPPHQGTEVWRSTLR